MVSQDAFIDEEDDVCPLCIEEFDLSDRNFKPCPCGYQVCQFCYNNIKNNMNGLCPACRRPYDDANIQYKSFSQEELVEFSKKIQKDRKKRALDQRQKEVQKREAEKENRKNLVGVRVVQKNLVYVTGLTPTAREDELLKTLRKPEFFGQYGNILKISISNRKSSDGQNPSLGIYVTFEKKEEASRCIQAVNNSTNGDRVLRAQLGTTKYCSAWLRHEQCQNKSCMFLHELGDEEDSYTRQDLSSMNMIKAQYTEQPPISTAGPSRAAPRQQSTPAPPTAAAQPTARPASREGSENDGDGSALPSSANWAKNSARSRRGSYATSGAASSPAISTSLPVMTETTQEAIEQSPIAEEPPLSPAASEKRAGKQSESAQSSSSGRAGDLSDSTKALIRQFRNSAGFSALAIPSGDLYVDHPPLFDLRLGMRRIALRKEEEARLAAEQEESMGAPEGSEGEPEESGSLALGGEPEVRDHARETHSYEQRRASGQPPIQRTNESLLPAGTSMPFSQGGSGSLGSIGSRTMTPQQQLFMRPQAGYVEVGPSGNILSQSNLFQHQGHSRQGSRYSFANESSNTVSVKVAGNARFGNQASSMIGSGFASQPSQYYPSSMPGPPPGLKSTATPPSLFGQGRSFGSAFNAPKDPDSLLQSLVHGRGGGSQSHDAGKLDLADPSILQARMQQQSQSNAGVGQGMFGGQSQGGFNNPNVMYQHGYPRW